MNNNVIDDINGIFNQPAIQSDHASRTATPPPGFHPPDNEPATGLLAGEQCLADCLRLGSLDVGYNSENVIIKELLILEVLQLRIMNNN